MRDARTWIALSLLGMILPVSTPAKSQPETLAGCEARLRQDPKSPRSYRCFSRLGNRNHEWERATQYLNGVLQISPDNAGARETLANLTARQWRKGAEDLYRKAIAGFQAQQDIEGSLHARLDLVTFLQIRLRLKEAEAELALAAQEAARTGDLLLTAWVGIGQAWAAYHHDTYGKAAQILRASQDTVFSRGSPDLQSAWLSALGAALWGQGLKRESLDTYRHQATLLHKLGDLYEEAGARRNALLLESQLTAAAELTPAQIQNDISRDQEILHLASISGNRNVEAEIHLSLAQELDSSSARRTHIRKALALHGKKGSSSDDLFALRLLAHEMALFEPRDIPQSFKLLDRSLNVARRSGALFSVARTWIARASLQWDLAHTPDASPGMRERAMASSQEALEAIEALRERQKDSLVRARTFSSWAFFYQRFAGQLFRSYQETASMEDLDLAFTTQERMRARVLLDDMDAGHATTRLAPAVPLARRREQRLDELARIQTRLNDTGLSDKMRETLMDKAQGLAGEARTIQAQLVRQNPVFRSIRAPQLASLRQVRENLMEDEALMSFQMANGMDRRNSFYGGSWLLVQTRRSTRLYPLPEEKEMKLRIQMFLGLISQRDGSEVAGAVRLYDDLLAAAMHDLDPQITCLIIVPDGPLHRLPFGILRPEPGLSPLGLHHRICLAPSATSWLRWRQTRLSPADKPILAVVEPRAPRAPSPEEQSADSLDDDGENLPVQGIWRGGASSTRLHRLPYAYREIRAIRQNLGRDSVFLEGPAASEAAVKAARLNQYEIIHFATHALVDRRHPERTALLLARGNAGEDGNLGLDDIVGLDLGGRVVVLSSCGSASGTLLRGEGMVSLGRAFFIAGARAVIGILWRMRDEDAAVLFASFYRHLGRGESLAGSLMAARREQVQAGAPTSAWGGFVLYGRGDMVPFPGGRSHWTFAWWQLALLATLLALTAAFLALRNHLAWTPPVDHAP